jgi:hypothetical protein
MTALHGGRRDKLEIAPNLWAGVGLVRGGAGTSLVGDAATVAERLQEYADLGVDTFVLSGYPHLEEAIRFAELVFPLLGKNAVTLRDRAQTGGAFDIRAAASAPERSSASGNQLDVTRRIKEAFNRKWRSRLELEDPLLIRRTIDGIRRLNQQLVDGDHLAINRACKSDAVLLDSTMPDSAPFANTAHRRHIDIHQRPQLLLAEIGTDGQRAILKRTHSWVWA